MKNLLWLLFLVTAGSPAWAQTEWRLADTKTEIRKDVSETPGKWTAGESGVAIQKRWYNPNADKNFVIVSSFGWAGIPLILRAKTDQALSVTVHQQANNETGYDSWVKIYAGEVGGVELDGPFAQASWREPQCEKNERSSLRVPEARPGSQYQIRVHCKVAGDVYETRYLYVPGGTASSPRSESLSGAWVGTWSNSLQETGPDSLTLSEDSAGGLTGVWSGNIQVQGRRLSSTEFELQGRNDRRQFLIRGRLEGEKLRLTYTAQRLDAQGSYSGESRFQKR